MENIETVPLRAAAGSLEEARDTAQQARDAGADWLVLDGYHFTPDYRAAIKAAGLKLLVVDDLAESDLSQADILLNPNLYASPAMYEGHKGAATLLLLGVRWTLLRWEFLQQRGQRARHVRRRVLSVLVTLGGADPPNATKRVMELLAGNFMPLRLRIFIVAGAANPHLPALEAALPALLERHNAELLVNPPNLVELMTQTDLAVSAAGTSAWELACLGVPMALIVTAENQQGVAKALATSGVALLLGAHESFPAEDSFAEITQLMKDQPRRLRMRDLGRSLVDGRGAVRAAEALAVHPLRLRLADFEDARLLHDWAHDLVTREMSFSSDPIPWENHVEWLNRQLGSDDCRLFIVMDDREQPIGQVRLDRERESRTVTLSLSIAPEARGQGHAAKLARLAAQSVLDDQWCGQVRAWVKPENTASLHAFRRAGYTELGPQAEHPHTAVLFVMPAPVQAGTL